MSKPTIWAAGDDPAGPMTRAAPAVGQGPTPACPAYRCPAAI